MELNRLMKQEGHSSATPRWTYSLASMTGQRIAKTQLGNWLDPLYLVLRLALVMWVVVGVQACATPGLADQVLRERQYGSPAPPADDTLPQPISLTGHSDVVTDFLVTKDGKYLVTASKDWTIIVWDVVEEVVVRRFNGHKAAVTSIDLSQDEAYLVSGSLDETVRVWDFANGKELQRFVPQAPEWHGSIMGIRADLSGQRYREVTSVQFAGDRDHVLCGSGAGFLLVEWRSARQVRHYDPQGIAAIYLMPKSIVVSPDGRYALTATGKGMRGDAELWEIGTGRNTASLSTAEKSTVAVAFKGSVSLAATASDDGNVFLWSVDNGQPLGQLVGHSGRVNSAAFSEDGESVLTGSEDGTVRLWDLASGKQLNQLDIGQPVDRVGFYEAKKFVLATGFSGVQLWDTEASRIVRRYYGEAQFPPTSTAVSLDGNYVASGFYTGTITVWDSHSGRVIRQLKGHTARVSALSWSSDNTTLVSGSADNTMRLWNIQTGREVFKWTIKKSIDVVLVTSDRQTFLAASGDKMLLLRATDQPVLHTYESGWRNLFGGNVKTVALSPDSSSKYVAAGYRNRDAGIRVWDRESGEVLWQFGGVLTGHRQTVTSLIFTPDLQKLISAGKDKTVRVWDLRTGEEAYRIDMGSPVSQIVYDSSSDHLIAILEDNEIQLWKLTAGKLVRSMAGHAGEVRWATFLSDGQFILSSGRDATYRLWETSSGEQVAAYVQTQNGGWFAYTLAGLFDGSEEGWQALAWRFRIPYSGEVSVLPVEIFFREYFHPRLLPEIFKGSKPTAPLSITQLNHIQPHVKITSVTSEPCIPKPCMSEEVSVSVEVFGNEQTLGEGAQQKTLSTGVYDLRLFRDGQLVGQVPQEGSQSTTVGLSADDELRQWRQERRVVDLKEGARQIVFKGIRLPRRAGINDVEFSAYAFNEDRVKSETARRSFALPAELSPRVPRAYIVSVGVNAFEDPHWDLNYAANDATQLSIVLTARLQALRDAQGQPAYESVVSVELTAEADVDSEGKRRLTKVQARKAQIEAVLKVLAGQPVNDEALKGIKHAEQLRRANPEDLVILALSTHGEVDQQGRFYLLPHDIGTNPTEQQRRTRAISNDELSAWLQGLDAIDLVMIVDACHSAASVQSKEFKPGPMGSRGLGQLAYDKGMRILAATQIDQYALETQRTQLGLLSYALVREGLEQNRADYRPQDQQIWLSEWFSYASERVPGLYKDWKDGTLKGRKKGEFLDAPEAHPGDSPSLQQPALFDFARKRDALIGAGSR